MMELFSGCGIGLLLAAQDGTVLDANEAAIRMLHAESEPRGKPLAEAAPFLCGSAPLANPAFGVYLRPCHAPDFRNLPPGTQLLAFRDASAEVRSSLLESVLDHIPEAVTLWDAEGRSLLINSAAERLESHIRSDIAGQYVADLYHPRNDSRLMVPQILGTKKAQVNQRVDFVTHTGKELQTISNNYPILKGSEVVAAVCILEDYTQMDALYKEVVELRRRLLGETTCTKGHALSARYHFNDIIYTSGAMHKVISRCRQAARSDSSVMIYGETGTGKELFAQSIHNESRRAKGPFLAMNCAAIPQTLLEAMLFGTEKGAYTGAERREGLFEQADGGTLLLDEINSMDITLQSKLLRVLQEGCFWRVGGSKLIHVNVRVISNINIPPLEAIEKGQLRPDLYYRLGVVNINIPPLRERKEDLPLLIKNFITAKNERLLKNAEAFSPAATGRLYAYDWPGNVRELQHAIEYALNIIPNETNQIASEYLPDHILAATGGMDTRDEEEPTLDSVMNRAGAQFLQLALLKHGGNISHTAQALGMTRQNLQHRMKKLGVSVSDSAEK